MPPITRCLLLLAAAAAFAVALVAALTPLPYLVAWLGNTDSGSSSNAADAEAVFLTLVALIAVLRCVRELVWSTAEYCGPARGLPGAVARLVCRRLTVWAGSAWLGGIPVLALTCAGRMQNGHGTPLPLHFVVTATALIAYAILREWRHPRHTGDQPVRGSTLDSTAAVQLAVAADQQHGGARIPWGGFDAPASRVGVHWLTLGTSGSGKTLLHRMIMSAVLSDQTGLAVRAIVYDPKRELYPLLVGMGVPEHRVSFFQPFDARSVAWDIAADVTSPDVASEMAAILMPAEGGETPYWLNTPRRIVGTLMGAFHAAAPGNWSLNDLMEAASTLDTLRAALSVTDAGRDMVEKHLTSPADTVANLLSTIDSKLCVYETIARLWTKACRKLSLRDWHRDSGVILLGTHSESETAFGAINRAVLKRASQIITGRPDENPTDETWVFVDEAMEAGKIDGLRQLLTLGRSKGAHVVLGFQDLDGFRRVYAEDADAMVGMCDNVAVLRLNSTNTQEWASRFFGEYEHYQRSYGESNGEHRSTSVQEALSRRLAVLPQEFRLFKQPTPATGLTGVFATPAYGAWKITIPGRYVGARIGEPSSSVPAFIPRPVADVTRQPWTEADRQRLGIRPPPEPRARGKLRTMQGAG